MYAHYQKLAQDNMTQYPVALPLIMSGMIDAGGYKVKMNDVFSDMPKESTHDIYSLDGRLLRRNAKISDTFTTLPKGIYIINGCKVVKE